MSAYVTNEYIEARLSPALRNALLSNQGTYDASTATTILTYAIADASGIMDAALLQANGEYDLTSAVPDTVRSIVGAMVMESLYGRQGLPAPEIIRNTAKLVMSIADGTLPVPGAPTNAVGRIGGISVTPYDETNTSTSDPSYVFTYAPGRVRR